MSTSDYLHPPDTGWNGQQMPVCTYCGEVIETVDQECNELAAGWVCEP